MSHGAGAVLAARRRVAPAFAMRSTPTEAASASGTTLLTVAKPSGCQVGDRLFIYAHKPTATGALTAPTGFTLVVANAAGADRAHLYTRVVDGSEGSNLDGPARDVSTALLLFAFVFPPCAIEQAGQGAVTNTATIVGVDFTTNPSASAMILGCGGTNSGDTYTATPTPVGTLQAENNSGSAVSAYVMTTAFVTTAPGSNVFQGANRAVTGSVQKGAVACYLVPS